MYFSGVVLNVDGPKFDPNPVLSVPSGVSGVAIAIISNFSF